MNPVDHPDAHDHPEGLAADLARLAVLERRRGALRTLAGFGALAAMPLAGRAACVAIESETAGPYPADGTNGNGHGTVNALTQTGIVRSDIRSSFGSFSGTAAGVPLKVTLQLVSTAAACANLAGYAIYIWHCDRDTLYSLYTLPTQNWLRGLQATDANGQLTFTTIFPGCYNGRWPHLHFEVYRSLAVATQGTNSLKTSQIALPSAACHKVYDGDYGYDGSSANLSRITIGTDGVFGDDKAAHERPTMTGSAKAGYHATLVVGI